MEKENSGYLKKCFGCRDAGNREAIERRRSGSWHLKRIKKGNQMTEMKVWEFIGNDTSRMPITGGWLYRTVVGDEDGISVAMCFVPTAEEGT